MPESPENTSVVTGGLPEAEPMKVAAYIRNQEWPDGRLIHFRGSFYEYYGDQWQRRSDDWMVDRLWRAAENVMVVQEDSRGREYAERYGPTNLKIQNLFAALRALPGVRRDVGHIPMWLAPGDSLPAPEMSIGFQDAVVTLEPLGVVPRNQNWFDLAVVPANYDPEATCPLWEACLEQWSMGSEEWVTLLQRWFGYSLMNHRRYAKWLLMYGKTRAGKGVIARVLAALVGSECFQSAGVEDFEGGFVLEGFENTKVLSLTEAFGTERKTAERLNALIKRVVGGDPQRLHRKYKAALENVVIPAAPMMQANEIPSLPDRSGSVSSKMLLLPFHWSTRDPGSKEDSGLSEKLLKELPGIAMWALRGAVDLHSSGGLFPVLAEAEETRDAFSSTNSPMDAFLEKHFVKNGEGFVATDLIWERWLDWVKYNRQLNPYTRQGIRSAVKENTSWPLHFKRLTNGPRGLRGLSLRVQETEH